MSHLRAFWSRLRPPFHSLRLLGLTWACWLAVFGSALAAKKPAMEEAPASSGPTWAMAYTLVFLGIALGMLFVCRPSKRRDRAKPVSYGD